MNYIDFIMNRERLEELRSRGFRVPGPSFGPIDLLAIVVAVAIEFALLLSGVSFYFYVYLYYPSLAVSLIALYRWLIPIEKIVPGLHRSRR